MDIAKIKQRLCLFLGVLFLCWSMTGQADPVKTYQVEIIVFSHISEQGLKSEYWPELPPPLISPSTLELSDDQILPQSSWQLKTAHEQLENNQYPVLLHLAWQQSAAEARNGQIIHLTGGATYPDHQRQLDGSLFIGLQHFFNIHLKLRFLEPWESLKGLDLPNLTHPISDPYVSFKLDKSLRMRSRELNYIDHPLYGVLIEITPLQNDNVPAKRQTQ